jgi:hypothetical protein
MVGSVPCKLSSKVHINGRCVFGAKDKGVEREAVETDAGRSFKHSRVMSAEGQEIVGPGYSVPTCTPRQRHLPRGTSPHGACQVKLAHSGAEVDLAQSEGGVRLTQCSLVLRLTRRMLDG